MHNHSRNLNLLPFSRVVCRRQTAQPTSGFSILEILIALALFSIVVGGASILINSLQKGNMAAQDISRIQQDLRFGLDFVLRSIRAAGNDPFGLGFARFDLDPNGNNQNDDLRVRSDFNPPDGDIDDPREYMLFHLVGDVLTAEDLAAGRITEIAGGFSALVFEYFDLAGNPSVNPEEVVRVRVTLSGITSRPDPYTGQHRTISSSDEAMVRSFGDYYSGS